MVNLNNKIRWLLLLLIMTAPIAGALTIHDVQYTTDVSGNSPYNGQTVTLTGVVTGVVKVGTYANKLYYIQDGYGAWNGIYCYDRNNVVSLGDSVTVTGVAVEYNNLTELSPVNSFQLHKSGCALPQPVTLPTDSLATGSPVAEAYECVLVSTNKVKVTATPNSYYEWRIATGTVSCMVNDGIDSISHIGYTPVLNDSLVKVTGILDYNYGDFKIEPRMPQDIITFKPVKVNKTLPGNNNTNVPTQIEVGVEFNKAMDASSFTTGCLKISGSVNPDYPFTFVYDSTSYTLSIRPSSSFAPGESVKVWVSHSVMDTLGNTLDGSGNGVAVNDSTDDYSFSFVVLLNSTPIGQIQRTGPDGFASNLVGQTVVIEGIVSGPDKYFSSSTATNASWYIQDNTGGLNVYGGTRGAFQLGKRAVVTGTVTEYNGVTEVSSSAADITVWSYASEPIQPRALIYNQLLGESIEGMLVSVEGSISAIPAYAGGGYNMEVRNGNAPIAVRISESSGFDLAPFTYGTKVRATGIVSQYDKEAPYNSGYQLVPRSGTPYFYNGIAYQPDIEVLTDTIAPSASGEIVSITPNPFSPDYGQAGTIEVNAPAEDHLTLRIYDLKGRLVRTCLNNVPGGHHQYIWDGTDDSHRRVCIGMYIVHLRTVTDEGAVSDRTKVIVMGTKLN